MSCSNYCFLTCIQVSQDTSKVAWYSHLFKNSPQVVLIHTVKALSTVNEADVFLKFPCSFYASTDVRNLISGSSAFSKPSLYIRKFSIYLQLKPSLKDVELYLASVWNECGCMIVGCSLASPFSGIGMKTDLFQSCGHCWVFQSYWYILCSISTESSFRILNTSHVIPSPPLALAIVMLPKNQLTSHSRMSGCRWLTTSSCLTGH